MLHFLSIDDHIGLFLVSPSGLCTNLTKLQPTNLSTVFASYFDNTLASVT